MIIDRCQFDAPGGHIEDNPRSRRRLVAEAQRLTGPSRETALVRQALHALIERGTARRLAQLEGSEPDAEPVSRRQTLPA